MKIAILIPSFNSADTIGPTLESIQAQGSELRWIFTIYLADNSSEDDTIALAKASWKVEVPLSVLKQERNIGQSRNVNDAIGRIVEENADWVLLLHSDDIAKPHWLQMMTSRIKSCPQNVGSICSSWDMLQPNGSVIPGEENLCTPVQAIAGNVQTVRETLLRGCWWHVFGCAIRIRAFADVGGFDSKLQYMSDWEWLLRCLQGGWSVEYIPRTLILYRAHQNSVSSKSFKINGDIKESLGIIRSYRSLLTTRDLFSLHLRLGTFAVRRMGRSMLQFQWHRFLFSGLTTLLIMRNLIHSRKRSFPA